MLRRQFLQRSGSCCAHIAAMAAASPLMINRIFQESQTKDEPKEKSNVVAKEKWGTLEKVHEGVWAHIATPFATQDFTTVCNGGIIQGKTGVLAIEAFMNPKGATWLAEKAKELTGKWPTDIVCTHYHADHTAGHAGYFTKENQPRIWLTKNTKEASFASLKERDKDAVDFKNVSELNADKPTEIDLGNRKVSVVPRVGHSNSDVTIELADPNIVWCGDLFFNRMFPNYKDATPTKLNEYVAHLLKNNDNLYIPGHGPQADRAAVESYRAFLEFVEATATKAHKSGQKPVDAAKEFKLPDSLKDWIVWSPTVVEPAYAAWFKHFDADKKPSEKNPKRKSKDSKSDADK